MTDGAGTRHPAVVGVIGSGVVGGRIKQRITTLRPDARVVVIDSRVVDLVSLAAESRLDVAILAHRGPHRDDALQLIECGVGVVSLADEVDDVRTLLSFDGIAGRHGVPLVVGAGMSPGLVGLLARHLTTHFDTVDEIHVAIHGTAGPACARQHHQALAGTAVNWNDGVEVTRRAGTGRELVWFPEPVGAYDCYRAEMPTAMILRRSFPDARWVSTRLSANRRDRLTSRLPMLTPPHREGGVGAVRVELRGAAVDGARVTLIAGIAELVGTAAAATATAFADRVIDGTLGTGVVVPGDVTLDTTGLLRSIERLGVRLQEFTGVPNA